MADHESKDIKLLKGTTISVFVDEALPDIVVVTYEFGVQIFKGVLLDSTKRNLPCGVPTVNPAFKIPSSKPKLDDDVLYSVNQRFAYTDTNTSKKKNLQIPSKYKNSKMTVRLRPRQVLCTKCKGICNENSESVSRKRKSSETAPASSSAKRGTHARITRSVTVHTDLSNKRKLGEATLVPKLTRLTPEEEMNAINGGSISKILGIPKKPLAPVSNVNKENTQMNARRHSIEHSEDSSNSDDTNKDSVLECTPSAKGDSRSLRNKRSADSLEDLWNETAFEENASKNNNLNAQTNANEEQTLNANNISTKTIKICYGPQGKGTVLKIPAQIDTIAEENEAAKAPEESKSSDNKAARKAQRKARKEARRKVFLTGGSPCYLGSGSPRYSIAASSPRYTVGSASPRHGLGNNSPRYMCSSYDTLPRRRKHKMKHKRKHKDEKDRKHKEEEVSSTQEDHKEQCITQKLSINLKRLNNTYTSYSAPAEENTSSSDDQSDQVPDFSPPNSPITLRINSQSVTSAPTADGGRIVVGDVVWGKTRGFPWWPAKITTIINCDGQDPQAHVSWYGFSETSRMQFDQLNPYLENFKIRYIKKKKGAYQEAIKQATSEAKANELRTRHPLIKSPAHNIITQVVPPALASPREIDVVS